MGCCSYSLRAGKRFVTILLFWALIVPKQGNSQKSINKIGVPYFRNYTPKEYHADPQNWGGLQLPNGVLIFGNTNGLLVYDGTSWKVKQVRNYSMVRSLDNDGSRVYVGAINEFGYFDFDASKHWRYVSLRHNLNTQDKDIGDFFKTISTEEGVYFFSNKGCFFFDHHDENLIHVSKNPLQGAFFVNGILFVHTLKNELAVIHNKNSPKLQIINAQTDFDGSIVIKANTEDEIIVFTSGGNIFKADIALLKDALSLSGMKSRLLPLRIEKENRNPVIYIQKHGLQCGLAGKNNTWLLGTRSGGVVVFDDAFEVKFVFNAAIGIQNDNIHNVFCDSSNNYWLCMDNGITKLARQTNMMTLNEKNNEIKGVVLSALKHNNQYYLGTAQALYYFSDEFSGQTNKFIKLTKDANSFWGMYGYKGLLMVGTNNGVSVFSNGDEIANYQIGKTYEFFESKVNSRVIYVGTYKGLGYFTMNNYANGNVVKYEKIEEINAQIWNIQQDSKGGLWLSTLYDGIIYVSNPLSKENRKVYNFKKDHGLPQQLNNIFVHYFNRNIYLATQEGVFNARTDTDNPAAMFFRKENYGRAFKSSGLLSVNQIFYENEDTIWLSSTRKIGRIIKKRNGEYFWEEMPIKERPTYIHRFYVQPEEIWLCSNIGLTIIDKTTEIKQKSDFNALITDVYLEADSLIYEGRFNCKKSDQYVFSEKIDYDLNSISFYYSATSYAKEDENEFSYFLEGFDEGWSEWSVNHYKEYTNLSEGNYTFRIKSRNIFGQLSPPKSFSFEIKAPWYRTFGAKISYFVFFLGIIIISVRIYAKQLQNRNLWLEKIIKQRTQEIEQQKEEIVAQAEQLEVSNRELEKLSIVARKTDNAIAITDHKGVFEWVNDSFTKLYGHTVESLESQGLINIADTSANPDITTKIKTCIQDGVSVHYENQGINARGKQIWTTTTLTPIQDIEGKVIKMIAIDTDITEIKKAEKEIGLQKEKLETEKQKSETLLHNILPKEIALELIRKGAVKPKLYRKVTVMFADFRGFTKICEKLPFKELVYELDNHFKKFDAIIDSFYIEKIKTIGDAYMCASGLPMRNNRNHFDIVLAALRMQDYMNSIGMEKKKENDVAWDIRIGIHTGPVFAGVVGRKKFAYDIWGDTVNIAARMEEAGEVNKINITEATFEKISEYFDCQYRGELQAKNKGLIKMYFVNRIKKEYSADEKGISPNEKFIFDLNRL